MGTHHMGWPPSICLLHYPPGSDSAWPAKSGDNHMFKARPSVAVAALTAVVAVAWGVVSMTSGGSRKESVTGVLRMIAADANGKLGSSSFDQPVIDVHGKLYKVDLPSDAKAHAGEEIRVSRAQLSVEMPFVQADLAAAAGPLAP